ESLTSNGIGIALLEAHAPTESRQWLADALVIQRGLGLAYQWRPLCGLGYASLLVGDLDGAEARIGEAIAGIANVGYAGSRDTIWYVLGLLRHVQGQYDRAAEAFTSARQEAISSAS